MFFFLFLHTCSVQLTDPQFNFHKLPEKIPLDFPKNTDSNQNDQECPLDKPELHKPIKLSNLSTSFLLNSPKPNKMGEFPCYKDKIGEIVKLEKFQPLDRVGVAEAWLRAELAVFYAESIFEYISNLESRLSDTDRMIFNREFTNVKCASESIKLLMGSRIDELRTVDKELAQFFIYDVESETKSN